MAGDNLLVDVPRRPPGRKVTPEADSMARGRARRMAAGFRPIDPWIPAEADAALAAIAKSKKSTKKAEAARLLTEAIAAYIVEHPLPLETQNSLFDLAS